MSHLILKDAAYFMEDPSAPKSSVSTVEAKKIVYHRARSCSPCSGLKKKKRNYFPRIAPSVCVP